MPDDFRNGLTVGKPVGFFPMPDWFDEPGKGWIRGVITAQDFFAGGCLAETVIGLRIGDAALLNFDSKRDLVLITSLGTVLLSSWPRL